MLDTAAAALFTASGSLIVAVISGGISLWNRRRTNENSTGIESLRGAIGRDLERLKAKLTHGQLVSSTQWNAEFTAYQAIWKGMVEVRTLAQKIVLRENELVKLGVHAEYLASSARVDIKKGLLEKLVNAGKDLLIAIHDNAPFYPSPIREVANHTHQKVTDLLDQQMSAFVQLNNGVDVSTDPKFIAESRDLMLAIIEGTDRVESLIRDRLAAVRVVNTASVVD